MTTSQRRRDADCDATPAAGDAEEMLKQRYATLTRKLLNATARKKDVTLTRWRGDADAIRGRYSGDAKARDFNVTASQRRRDADMTVTL